MSKRLWAPWRLDYIKSDKQTGCIFCSKPAAKDDAASLIVHRGEHCYVILNAYPYTNGHLMIAPFEHVGELHALDRTTASELMALSQQAMRALDHAYRPDGYNLGMNLGVAAGAGVEGHVHMHVVPRWAGDTNFMPVLGETRVLPEQLDQTYNNVRNAFTQLEQTA